MRTGIGTVIALFGLLAMIGLMTSTLPYRPAHGQTMREAADNAALRARLVELRTRVEIMQFEHDAARATLLPIWWTLLTPPEGPDQRISTRLSL
jgi:hypothetical protein